MGRKPSTPPHAVHPSLSPPTGVWRVLPVKARRAQAGVALDLLQLPRARALCHGGQGAAGVAAPGASPGTGVDLHQCLCPHTCRAATHAHAPSTASQDANPAHSAPACRAQAIILLLFNEAEQLTFGEIQAAIKLEDSELRRTLASLSLAKERCVAEARHCVRLFLFSVRTMPHHTCLTHLTPPARTGCCSRSRPGPRSRRMTRSASTPPTRAACTA